ncbi:hypothetical protein [Martelella limonii]|uniref:hypothetical protein n=1 Tax=Martelella limonii TaxID=1647649 RepID=UPI001580CB1A|nr:hypothetical protein [Martelella limonii]
MTYQFVHIETYARKPKAVKGSADHYNNTVQVFGEARRVPKYSTHVKDPASPHEFGGNLTLAELERKHDKLAASAVETVRKRTGATYSRRLSENAPTLYTEIHSHPATIIELRENQDNCEQKVKNWFSLALSHFRKRMPKGIDWCAVTHVDESHVHFHILAINTPDPKLRANLLHVGKRASTEHIADKDETAPFTIPRPKRSPKPAKPRKPHAAKKATTRQRNEAQYQQDLKIWRQARRRIEEEDAARLAEWRADKAQYLEAARKAYKRRHNKKTAYRVAMEKFQDDYFEHVGKPCGLLRDGPRGQRLSTKEAAARKATAESQQKRERQLKQRQQHIAEQQQALSSAQNRINYVLSLMNEITRRWEKVDRPLSRNEILSIAQSPVVKQLRHQLGDKSAEVKLLKSFLEVMARGVAAVEGSKAGLAREAELAKPVQQPIRSDQSHDDEIEYNEPDFPSPF